MKTIVSSACRMCSSPVKKLLRDKDLGVTGVIATRGAKEVTVRARRAVILTCGGFENMVPIWKKGKKPKVCIDVFEFPNKPCELPLVWTAPVQAKVVCELQGKRLCAQEEWTLACNGDPDGGIPAGTPFEEIPDTWFCPVCGARKRDFTRYEE